MIHIIVLMPRASNLCVVLWSVGLMIAGAVACAEDVPTGKDEGEEEVGIDVSLPPCDVSLNDLRREPAPIVSDEDGVRYTSTKKMFRQQLTARREHFLLAIPET